MLAVSWSPPSRAVGDGEGDGLASRGEPATERSEGAGSPQGERWGHGGYDERFSVRKTS